MLTRQLTCHGFHSTGWILLCLASVVVAITLIVMLLRYERQLVSPKVGNTLLALRLAVAAFLFLTLMEPVLSWTLDRERTGRILVAVDVSNSMSTADNHAGKAEKLQWARSMGMIGNPSINDRLDLWVAAYQVGEEPRWVDDDESSDPEHRKQLAEGRKENLDGIFNEIDQFSRKKIALHLLAKTASPLLAQLKEVGNVELRLFAGKSESADETTLEASIDEPPKSVAVELSNLSEALTGLTSDAETSPLLGVVLFTDGRDNSERDPTRVAARLRDLNAPIYPVVLGSELQPKDLAIATLDYPQSAFKDDRPLLKASLNTSGFEGQEITVVLEQQGDENATQTKTITPDGATAQLEFELDATDIGRREYTIRTDVLPGETREDNNSQSFAMSVVDDKARVLLLEGEARWEFRFINNALARDDRVDNKQVVFRQPYLRVLPQTFFPQKLEMPADLDDLENSPFAEPDMVIIGDVAPYHMPDAAWDLLEKFVAESGGTLVMIAGKRHFPLAYDSKVVEQLVPLTDLKPVHLTGVEGLGSPTDRGFHLRLTPEGENESILQFDADRETNREIWGELPGHLWGIQGKAKPGATVFAFAEQPGEDAALEASRRGAMIVHQHYGFGQVLWLGIDSTWRWRHRVGDKYHHRFWGQLARWAASNKAAVGNEFVKFGPDRTDIEVGEDAIIRARWTQRFLRKSPNLKAKAEIYRITDNTPNKPFTTLKLHPIDTRPLIHEGRVVSLPAGAYRIKLIATGGDLGLGEVATMLYVHDKQTLELSDLSSNRELLTQLAEMSGGKVFRPDEVLQIPKLFQDPDLTTTIRREITVWDHWLILLVFFGLLTTEWVVRKLNGLP